MIDHVTVRVPSLADGHRFYGYALELLGFVGEPAAGDGFVEWDDFSICEESPDRPTTRRLHLGFSASSPADVDTWWHALVDAGHRSDGAPGPRPAYGVAYYGAFVLDPAGNSVEAVCNGPRRQPGVIDHLWFRTRSLEDASRFYEAVCPAVAHTVERYDGRTQIRGTGATFSLVEGEPTANAHLAFAAADRDAVVAFHRAGVDAGFASDGEPGERPRYHPGYYAAYLEGPDRNGIEAVVHERPTAG